MAGGENEKKEDKGFAGLASLVSDMDTPPPPAAKKEPAADAPSAPRPAPQPAQPQPQSQTSQRQTYQEPSQPSSGSSGVEWVLGIAAVIGVLWLIGQADKSTTSSAPSYSPPTQSAAPSNTLPTQPQAPSRPLEVKPPIGQGLVLSREQIRYCLAEDIRMEGAKSALNNYSDYDVDRFNAMVTDYNSRCGSFRYRSGTLESARRDIEPYRAELYAQGRGSFARLQYQSNFPPAQVYGNNTPQPSPPVQSYQSSNSGRSVQQHNDIPPEMPNQRQCLYKAVMTDDDYRACGISPPR